MSDERAAYLASGSGPEPDDGGRLDLIREILGRDATWSEPPPEVADRLLAIIGTERKNGGPHRSAASRRWILPAAALAAAAVVVAVLGLLGVFSAQDETIVPIAGTDLQPDATGQAAIRSAPAGWWIRLEVDDLPPAEDGTYYEGWVWNDDGAGVSIGTFHLRGGEQAVILWSGVDPEKYPAIWVTLEDEDGDPAASEHVVMKGLPGDN